MRIVAIVALALALSPGLALAGQHGHGGHGHAGKGDRHHESRAGALGGARSLPSDGAGRPPLQPPKR
jgi:hypothetical protein